MNRNGDQLEVQPPSLTFPSCFLFSMGGIPHQSSYPPSDYVYLVCLQAEETRNLNSGIYKTNKSVTLSKDHFCQLPQTLPATTTTPLTPSHFFVCIFALFWFNLQRGGNLKKMTFPTQSHCLLVCPQHSRLLS